MFVDNSVSDSDYFKLAEEQFGEEIITGYISHEALIFLAGADSLDELGYGSGSFDDAEALLEEAGGYVIDVKEIEDGYDFQFMSPTSTLLDNDTSVPGDYVAAVAIPK